MLRGSLGVVTEPFSSDQTLTWDNTIEFSGSVTQSGSYAISGAAVFSGAVTFNGDVIMNANFTFGNAVVDGIIVNGRISTGSAAGAALTIDSTYAYSEGQEYRYSVTDWAGVGSSFRAMYLRAQTGAAAANKELMAAEFYGVAQHQVAHLKGLLSYAYIKGATGLTIGTAYGLQGELTFDASAAAHTISTEASAGLLKITGGNCADFTKIHGLIVRAGDMDGQNRTYGNGILLEDDAAMAGTITWTTGLSITNPCTTGISLSGNLTDGVKISGGTITDAIEVGAATNALHVAGNVTNAVLVAGTQTTAIRIDGVGTNLFAFDAVEGALSTQATAFAGLSLSHKLAVLVDGVATVYIPLITAFA